MAKIVINPILLRSRLSYAVAAESLRLQEAATVVRKKATTSEAASANQGEIFWMRDPKTGNWIPENHFGQVDPAELREKFLSKRDKTNLKQLLRSE